MSMHENFGDRLMYIGGEFVASDSGEWMDSVNPANGEVHGRVPAGTAGDVARAVAAAKQAQPEWAALHVFERGRILRKLADAIRARTDVMTLEAADRIIAVSHGSRKDILDRFDVDERRVEVIYNGIDLDLYRPVDGDATRKAYDIDQDYILFVGRVSRQKGIEHLIDAVEQIDPSVKIVLCTSAPDTKELEAEIAGKQRLLESLSGVEFGVVVSFSDLMRGLALANIDTLSIDKFSVQQGRLNISGKAKNSDSVPLWLTKIQATDELSEIAFKKLQIHDKENHFSFNLSNVKQRLAVDSINNIQN